MPITQRSSEEGRVCQEGVERPAPENPGYTGLPPQFLDWGNCESSPRFPLIPRFRLCGVIGLGLLCLYAVFVSLTNNSASSQVSKRNPLRGRGSCPQRQSLTSYFSLLVSASPNTSSPPPHQSLPSPLGVQNSPLLCRELSSSKFLIPKCILSLSRCPGEYSKTSCSQTGYQNFIKIFTTASVTPPPERRIIKCSFQYCNHQNTNNLNTQIKGLINHDIYHMRNVTQLLKFCLKSNHLIRGKILPYIF